MKKLAVVAAALLVLMVCYTFGGLYHLFFV